MNANLIDMIEKHILESTLEVAFTFLEFNDNEREEINITYKDIYDYARAIAVSLIENGLKKGDRVIILSSQTYHDVYAIYAAIFAGAVFSIIPFPEDESKKQRFKSVLESSEAKFILCGHLTASMFKNGVYAEFLENPMQFEVNNHKIIDVDKCDGNVDKWVKPEILGTSLAYLQYTSGSTNAPKGVMVTYDNISCTIENLGKCFDNDIPKTAVFWTPIFHNMGLATIILDVYFGIRSIIMSPSAFMEKPINWFKAISEYKAGFTLAPNSAFDFCTRFIEDKELTDLDLSTLKYIINGSEPIIYKTLDSFSGKFEKCGLKFSQFCSGYGLAEATCVVSISKCSTDFKYIDYDYMQKNQFVESTIENPSKVQIVSVGKVMDSIKAVIVEPDTGKLRGENEIGEIWLQGPTVAGGYWKHDEGEDNVFMGVVENHDGFFLKTGDIGTIYKDNLYVIGRLKEVIVINGHNLYSQDIEANLKENIPLLRMSCVVSFSKTIDGREKVITCVEIADSINYDLKDIESKINKTLQKVFEISPYEIVFVRERSLPRTDNGKIKIIKARQLYEAGKLDIIYCTGGSEDNGLKVKEFLKPVNEVEEKLLLIFKKLLAQDMEISTNDSFFSLGGDSLAITQLAASVKDEFGVVIPLKYILENPTIQGVSECIHMKKENKGLPSLLNNKKFLYDECKLDESIVPDSTVDFTGIKCKNVFLTGSTGFVGAHLIKALMEQTAASIYCHVRAKNREDAFERIMSNAKYFKCWNDNYRERIIPVLGELTKPLLGIEEKTFSKLSEVIDTIYHNGALLNFIYPYSYLKNINVAGTEECLRLACMNKVKVFNHISTFSVFDNPSHFRTTAFEDDPLESEKGYFLGYTESKWVAEKLVRIAESRGLKVGIYRPGEITGAKPTGIWKMNDLVSRFIVACIQMECMPDTTINVHMTPVDFIADAIVHLSLQNQSIGKAFNLVNKKIKTVKELAGIISSFGYKIKVIPYEEWKQRLIKDSENALKLLEPLFLEEKSEEESITRRYADLEAHFDITNAMNGLKDTNISCAPVDKELIFKYLNHFIDAGYIPDPRIKEIPEQNSKKLCSAV